MRAVLQHDERYHFLSPSQEQVHCLQLSSEIKPLRLVRLNQFQISPPVGARSPVPREVFATVMGSTALDTTEGNVCRRSIMLTE